MPTPTDRITAALSRPEYVPMKPKALAKKLGFDADSYSDFKKALKDLIKQGIAEIGKGNAVRKIATKASLTGVFRKTSAGFGFVRLNVAPGKPTEEVFIPAGSVSDANTGDTVLIRLKKKPNRRGDKTSAEIVRVVERSTHTFVGTYFEREGEGLVRVDGTVFSHSISVGDPGAKGVQVNDKVVIEMLRFPTVNDRGEAVIIEVLGPRGKPGVDTLTIMRTFNLPDEFPPDALEEARLAAERFSEANLEGREDLTELLTITIDPIDARDFDDAVSVAADPQSGHWQLGVHIADVGHFAPAGGALDREARARATSIYLPQRVIPMFPELISNSLASLQQNHVRFVKSVFIDFNPEGVRTHVRFTNAAIRVKKRFSYEQVSEIVGKSETARGASSSDGHSELPSEIRALLFRMRDLAKILHTRRVKRGALELMMPEAELEYDREGKVSGAHFRAHDISHQMIEECMLAANEAVATFLNDRGIAFLRRVHPAPEPNKLRAFGEFAHILGYKVKNETDRYTLQRILRESADKPEVHAVHYALLRSLKQATYSPEEDEHYALATTQYCHFTSPIRRYPDLTVHRLLNQILKKGNAGSDPEELFALGDHCSKMERRAETAERELIKLKVLTFLSDKLGMEMEVVITGVADYGFFGQSQTLPIEGLVHISTLPDDYYYFDESSHSLVGQRHKQTYRLGDKVKVKVVRVDVQRRQLDFRLIETKLPSAKRKR